MQSPELEPGSDIRSRELYLELESPGEGRVKVFDQIRSGYQNAAETVHRLEENVLHLVMHPVSRLPHVCPHGKELVYLIEEENRLGLTVPTNPSVFSEYPFGILLALPNPATEDR